MLAKYQRFQLFLERLIAAPTVGTHDEALLLIATQLTAVEDEHSGIPANPDNWQVDGRLYPAQADSATADLRRPGVIVYRNRRHRTLIGPNGAIAIVEISSEAMLLEKVGQDGLGLPPPQEIDQP